MRKSLVDEENNGRILDLKILRRPFCVVGVGSGRVFTTSALIEQSTFGVEISGPKFIQLSPTAEQLVGSLHSITGH